MYGFIFIYTYNIKPNPFRMLTQISFFETHVLHIKRFFAKSSQPKFERHVNSYTALMYVRRFHCREFEFCSAYKMIIFSD